LLWALLAQTPSYGIHDIALTATVRPHNPTYSVRECDFKPVDKGLESLNGEFFDFHGFLLKAKPLILLEIHGKGEKTSFPIFISIWLKIVKRKYNMMYSADYMYQYIVKNYIERWNRVDINALKYLKSSYILLSPVFLGAGIIRYGQALEYHMPMGLVWIKLEV
jgi:hypothetical protein